MINSDLTGTQTNAWVTIFYGTTIYLRSVLKQGDSRFVHSNINTIYNHTSSTLTEKPESTLSTLETPWKLVSPIQGPRTCCFQCQIDCAFLVLRPVKAQTKHVAFTRSHTFIHWWHSLQEQFWVQYLRQSYFNIQTWGAGDQTPTDKWATRSSSCATASTVPDSLYLHLTQFDWANAIHFSKL